MVDQSGPEKPDREERSRAVPWWRRPARLRALRRGANALAVAALSLLAVGTFELVLQPHRQHVQAGAALREVIDSLRVSIDRRDDLAADLRLTWDHDVTGSNAASQASPTNGEAPFPYTLTRNEKDGYRRAAVAELYDLHLRMASMIRRGNQLVVDLDGSTSAASAGYNQICSQLTHDRVWGKRIACGSAVSTSSSALSWMWSGVINAKERVLDSAVTPGSYVQTVYHVGSLFGILLAFLAIAIAALAMVGTVLGIGFVESIQEFVMKAVPTALPSLAPFAAGVLGASVLTAGLGGASVIAVDKFFVEPGSHRQAVVAAGEAVAPPGTPTAKVSTQGAPADLALGKSQQTNPTWNSIDVRPETALLTAIAAGIDRIAARPPAATVVVPPDPALAIAVARVASAIDSLAEQEREGLARAADLSETITGVATAIDRGAQSQHALALAVRRSTDATVQAVGKVSAATHQVRHTVEKLVPIAADTACQLRWQKSLNARNGFTRAWHAMSGYDHDPCAPE